MEMRERFTDMRELDLKVESKFIYIRKYVKAVYGSINACYLRAKSQTGEIFVERLTYFCR